ncbi:bifunctional phosphopantothenoylcysteine decarboxylase/phosphopantothenate--cysteine ligase CoaBC [Desulfopila inferna]|uniref:bifunctional phosphopantothenoylcysteine decarboxylase/phosphopantothenate--cysteine ligase CoaBC n=1 Tax=Desulfopila inferna TaxID=468528 RepID=UPI001966052F|nr:bifunctional phosphopantothenoylcysteine decarboxylase/phosphopantothenate--cysteine ligase CoaBC [Desulfopila inferna]MBM9602731.1 bifunctional phosphopantothenoylcysteine decarboxylase/phosphopantothenate--cysteine ligase CoaBC [Desulfopila inferna]
MEYSFAGKRIVVGITGSIAAFKVAGWVSTLAKEEARVAVVMTESAQKFIAPLTFSALTGEPAYTSMFNQAQSSPMSHIDLAQDASAFLIAPASARTIARLAHGIADDLLSTTVLATRAPVVVCPAMNPKMYLHQATQDNLERLRQFGYHIVDPDSGLMACKDEGQGRLVEWESVQEVLLRCLLKNDLQGERILITAGPTREALDPARFISNRSSGKMGYALARAAYRRGADVVLVSGPTALQCPFGVKRIDVVTAREMYDAVLAEFNNATMLIKSAAVSDFRPAVSFEHKVKKENAGETIEVVRNPDILYEIGRLKRDPEQIVVGFAAESGNLIEEGKIKLQRKNLDLIAVNDITSADSGFEVETNKMILIDAEGSKQLPWASKTDTAHMIFDYICQNLRKTGN